MIQKSTTVQKREVAVIDVGSTAIRMAIAEIDSLGNWKIIDRLNKPIPLGKNVFLNSKISRELMIQSVKILAGYKEVLRGWQIDKNNVKAIATSALRDAVNSDTFIDQMAVRTGFKISIIEGIEENRLTYLAVQYALRNIKHELSRSNSVIIEVGGGSTEFMFLQRGKIKAAHSFNIGTVRIEEQIKYAPTGSDYMYRFLNDRIQAMFDVLDSELELKRIRHFIAVGGHMRLTATKIGGKEEEMYKIIEKRQFEDFVFDIQHLSVEDLVSRLQISYNDAEGLLTSLLTYLIFFERTSANQIIIPNVSIREGMLVNMTMGPDPLVKREFYSQIIASAVGIGRKYHFDENHATHVASLALKLFDNLKEEHGMIPHARLLLEVSAILHDIGSYVRFSGHHKHGQYLINNSEIFGLNRDDVKIISNVVRYHRKAMPSSAHSSYTSLPWEDRIRVLKLSAMLRVADALDRSHTRRIGNLNIEKTKDEVILKCDCQGDISLERLALSAKGAMFEEVFGLKVVLV